MCGAHLDPHRLYIRQAFSAYYSVCVNSHFSLICSIETIFRLMVHQCQKKEQWRRLWKKKRISEKSFPQSWASSATVFFRFLFASVLHGTAGFSDKHFDWMPCKGLNMDQHTSAWNAIMHFHLQSKSFRMYTHSHITSADLFVQPVFFVGCARVVACYLNSG